MAEETAPQLNATIEKHAALWKSLREKLIVVTTTRGGERAFHRAADVALEAKRLAEAGVDETALEPLCVTLEDKPPSGACVVDMLQAASLVKEQRLGAAEAILRARVRYQGTDGVRGKVASDVQGESALSRLVERMEFTPEVCELLCAGLMLARGPGEPPRVVIAEDGRDAFGERKYAKAAIRAFVRFGCKVLDLGIAPTPLAPVAAAKLGAEIAAVVTASHNPADQNGIKFFINGRKPLPETGDYPLSAGTFIAALEGMPKEKNDDADKVDTRKLLGEYVREAMTPEEIDALRGAKLILDVAHGSFAPYAGEILAGYGLSAVVINVDMTGENINRESGVAYIEGKERIKGSDVGSEIALVGRVRARAKECKEPVFGIAFDADGDRGLVLVHDAAADEVRIIDGDRLAFLIVKAAKSSGSVAGRVFAGTVESDLAVFDAVERMKIDTVLTPVGDRWLSARKELTDKLLIGEEASGHLVWPVEISAAGNRKETVVTGNGILTGLRGVAAILRLGLKPVQAAEPFESGVFKTFHAYFTDRARFFRGSPVWQEDAKIVETEVEKLKAAGKLPAKCKIRQVDFEDDPDTLYLKLAKNGDSIGAIFARNSGTENKTATYARGLAEYRDALVGIARAINESHMRTMKDARIPEARAGMAIAAEVREKHKLSLADARKIAREHGIETETGFVALLFALAREGQAKRIDGEIVSPNS